MTVLHGTWVHTPEGGQLWLWGEQWRSLPRSTAQANALVYYYQLSRETLGERCQSLGLGAHLDRWTEHRLRLPTGRRGDRRSSLPLLPPQVAQPVSLKSSPQWAIRQVGGYPLTGSWVKVLAHLPPGESGIAPDLRAWGDLCRWVLDLVRRGRYLPGLVALGGGRYQSQWLPLLQGVTEQERLAQWGRDLPPIMFCAENSPPTAAQLVAEFLPQAIAQVVAQSAPPPDRRLRQDPTGIGAWYGGLVGQSPAVWSLGGMAGPRLHTAWQRWVLPYQIAQENRGLPLVLRLEAPAPGEENWWLAYGGGAWEEGDRFIPAAEIWRGGSSPVDLLRGLGRAVAIWPDLAPSLETANPLGCALTAIQVYQLVRELRHHFAAQGIRCHFPPELALEPAGDLGLQLTASLAGTGGGFAQPVACEWAVVLRGQPLEEGALNQWFHQGSPLVRFHDTWVMLDPGAMRAVQKYFTTPPQDMALTLGDLWRWRSGAIALPTPLPIVSFLPQGKLAELLDPNGDRRPQPLDPPASFRGELRPYQRWGLGWLWWLYRWGLGGCLADDMGLGKTVQVLAWLLHLQEAGELTGPVLLVCPTSVLGHWKKEIQRFAPDLPCRLHHGGDRPRGVALQKSIQAGEVVLTSYALVVRDHRDLGAIAWWGIILDEAQNIKNDQTQQAKHLRQWSATHRLALTGTPIENRLTDLWALMAFLNPDFLGSKGFFQRRFAQPIAQYGDRRILAQLRTLVRPLILRRLKRDPQIAPDLPAKQEVIVTCGLSPLQRERYEALVSEGLDRLESQGEPRRRLSILTLLLRLKQVCNHGELIAPPDPWIADAQWVQGSQKVQRLGELLEEILSEGDRALVFTQFTQWGDPLKQHLQDRLGQEVLWLHGKTPRPERQTLIERFQEDTQGPPVLLLSLKTGGTGLNLTRANHVFHLDRWWNPAVENQASDRAFRIGQTQKVMVHKFICAGTVEERIQAILDQKQDWADQTLGTGEDWLTHLDINQLRRLLTLDRQAQEDF